MAKRKELEFIEAQAAKAREADNESLKAQAQLQQTANKAVFDAIAIYEDIFSVGRQMPESIAKLLPQMRESIATEREIALVRTQLRQMMPELTQDEVKHTAQLLANNPAMQQVIHNTVNRKNASQ
jgi:hypothetical protein